MSVPHLLVIEGNTAEARARQRAAGSRPYAESYADVLRSIHSVAITFCQAADEGVELPGVEALANFDGVVLTGSWLNIYEGGPAVEPQIELVRRVYQSGTPFFGSCWGLQVATVAAGGKVRRNPKGRELGIAGAIHRTPAGVDHPLLAGKPDAYVALTVHLDEVEELAPDTTVLAGNDWTGVQAAEIRHGNGVAWAVQYHPEFTFRDIAGVTRRYGSELIEKGTFVNQEAVMQHAALLERCETRAIEPAIRAYLGVDDSVLNPCLRTRELANWFEHLVLPIMSKRQRG
jgi:GMP synthase (glutamine-hydrolysing)